MLDGGLTADRAKAVLAHIDGCAKCTEVVSELDVFEDAHAGRLWRHTLEGIAQR